MLINYVFESSYEILGMMRFEMVGRGGVFLYLVLEVEVENYEAF